MRIGIVSEYYRPWPGGISEHVHHEAAELVRRGHEVVIITGPSKGPGAEIPAEDVGAEVLRFGFQILITDNDSLSRVVLGPFLLGLRRRFRRLRLDVLHVHAPMDPFLAWFSVALSPVATVGTFHANLAPSRLWNTVYGPLRPLTGRIFDRLDARIAVSRAAEAAICHYFPAEFEIIPNGVDTERFSPDVAPMVGLTEEGPRILFVGRPDPRKGLPLLVAAFEAIAREVPDARLILAGPQSHEIAPLVRSLTVAARDRIHCLGYVAPDDMPALYASCEVFCSPALGRESQGIVLLEAMAAGTAPVGFDIAGYRDVVTDGQDGLLVEEQTASSLAAAITGLLGDSQRLAAMAESGRKTAVRYAWPPIVDRLETSFERAIEHRKQRAGQAG